MPKKSNLPFWAISVDTEDAALFQTPDGMPPTRNTINNKNKAIAFS